MVYFCLCLGAFNFTLLYSKRYFHWIVTAVISLHVFFCFKKLFKVVDFFYWLNKKINHISRTRFFILIKHWKLLPPFFVALCGKKWVDFISRCNLLLRCYVLFLRTNFYHCWWKVDILQQNVKWSLTKLYKRLVFNQTRWYFVYGELRRVLLLLHPLRPSHFQKAPWNS